MLWWITWRALLITGTLAVTGWLIYEYNVFIVFVKIFWQWIIGAWAWISTIAAGTFVQTAKAMFMRWIFRPIWFGLGLTWASAYVVKQCKTLFLPRITTYTDLIVQMWRSWPWWVRACVILFLAASGLLLGLGLWMIPFGLPFAGSAIRKLKLMWLDSWLQRKIRPLRVMVRRIMRRRRHRKWAGFVRGMRYHRLRRDRRWNARANAALEAYMPSQKKRTAE